MSTRRYFSESEVTGLIPKLESIFKRIDELQNEIGARANELERTGTQPGGKVDEASDFVQDRREYNHGLVQEYHKEIEKIATHGGILADLELKIVDFPAQHAGEDIHLIWQSGRDKIEYYRRPGDDFHQRQRLTTIQ